MVHHLFQNNGQETNYRQWSNGTEIEAKDVSTIINHSMKKQEHKLKGQMNILGGQDKQIDVSVNNNQKARLEKA
jgi:hypothetical protein